MLEEKTRQMNRVISALDVFASALVFLVAYYIRQFFSETFYYLKEVNLYSHSTLLPLYLAFLLYFLSYFGAYRQPRGTPIHFYFLSITKSVTVSLGILFTIIFAFKITYASRAFFGLFGMLSILALFGIRCIAIRYFQISSTKGKNVIQLLIIGTGPRAKTVTEKLEKEVRWGFQIVGYIDPEPSFKGNEFVNDKILGSIKDIHKVLKNNVVDEVIIATPRSKLEAAGYVFYACEEEGVRVRFMADFFDFRVARVRVVNLADIPLLTLDPVVQDEVKLIFKRILDLSLTITALPFLLILSAIIAVAIRIDSPGPIFFIQERVGWKKRHFQMIKFRSMVTDAEDMMKNLEAYNEAQGPIFKIADDPRVTKVGKFLRRTSLDELPQLFNVLKGDMSLVGPRPMSLRDVNLFDKGIQRKRFSVKPGLTCYWQISGRSNLPFSEWLELDLKYINNWSLSLDLLLLFRTIPAVLFRKGAV